MATGNKGRGLPKFGEWDATNPGTAQGFTVIFNQARDDKKTQKTAVAGPERLVSPPRNDESHQTNNNNNNNNNKKHQHNHHNHHNQHNRNNPQTPRSKKKWLCFR